MTDAPASPLPPDGAAPGAMPIQVNIQYVRDLSFENPRAPQVFSQPGAQPQVQVGVDVQARQVGGAAYEVVLNINAEAKAAPAPDKPPETTFVVELSYAGVFTVPKLSPEQLRPLLLIECARLLFPFARQIVADATQAGGYPPMMINPIDFADLYRRQGATTQTAPSSPVPPPIGNA